MTSAASSKPSPPKALELGRSWNAESDAERRFHAFVVGLAKTGTSSLGEAFANFRAGHEFMFQPAIEQLAALRAGHISQAELLSFIEEREQKSRLELDSTSFNHFYLEHLLTKFPEAKLIFTVRDCLSWTESFLQMMLRNRQRHLEHGASLPAWQVMLGELMVGQFDPELFVSQATLQAALPQIVDGYLRFWTSANQRVLGLLPPERSLIVYTSKLSATLPEVCRFLGVSESMLVPNADHANRGIATTPLLTTLPRAWLLERAQTHCGALMARLFPEQPLV